MIPQLELLFMFEEDKSLSCIVDKWKLKSRLEVERVTTLTLKEFVPKFPNDLRKVPIGKRTWDTSKIGKLPTSNPYGMG